MQINTSKGVYAMGKIISLAQYDHKQGMTQPQAISQANQRRIVLLSNKQFDERLVTTNTWKSENEVYPAWTGTHITFDKGKLGSTVVYVDPDTNQRHVFDVKANKPEAVGEKNMALVINHGFTPAGKPTFELIEDGKDYQVQINDSSQLKMIAIPTKDWYLTDAEFGIPTGEKVSSNLDDARCLYRVETYSGLLARVNVLDDYDYRRFVNAGFQPSVRLGVMGETTTTGVNGEANVARPLAELAAGAQAAYAKINGVVDECILAPIRELIEAGLRQ